MRFASSAKVSVAPHMAARTAILGLLLVACQQQALPSLPTPQAPELPPVVNGTRP